MSRYRERYIKLINLGPDGLSSRLVFWVLWPFSLLFCLVVSLRSFLYRIHFFSIYRAGVPVISVGNLTVGGTGKTPVVDALIKQLVKRGKKVAVVSRGYGGTFKGSFGRVTPAGGGDVLTSESAGDEPFLLALKNPDAQVYIARKRRFGVAAAEADGAECIVLDDAFQHLAVARDLDLVLLDGRAPFGNGALLPAGNLRESPSALGRANLLILTHDDTKSFPLPEEIDAVRCRRSFSDHLVDAEGESLPWEQIDGKRCLAFAGIARPVDFFEKLSEKGCKLDDTIALADHQKYSREVVERIVRACQNVDYLLTTEKDLVKLLDVDFPVPCLAAPLVLEFDNFDIVEEKLNRVLGDNHA